MQHRPTAARVPDSGIRELFTREARWQSWLDVEAALARAEAELDMIPADAAVQITEHCRLELLDMEKIEAILAVTAHPLVPLIWELDRILGDEIGGYVHWGATTQNITQTGDILQLRKAHEIILGQIGQVLALLAPLAERHADDPCAGRTHGQHAVPATFGYKVGAWIDELCQHVERLHDAEPRIFVAMLGGAAGTLASFGAPGLAVQEGLARHLDLLTMPVPGRTSHDHHAEYAAILAMLAATSRKIADETYTLMKPEFGEIEEPVPPGTVGSSTMPQKRNPKLSQDIRAAAAQVTTLFPLALDAMRTEHEADGSTSVMIERVLHGSIELVGDILSRLAVLFDGIEVKPERMRQNLDLSGGLIMSERIMLALGERVGRQRAHDVVYEHAQDAAVQQVSFRDLLVADEEVRRHLSEAELDHLLDPASYTGACGDIARAQAQRAREFAEGLDSAQS
ncbi:MAG: adenylosuccinate lyase family protein [Chloroflexi bacterium]|nr:adenylosuccinate lyase family protein [Chloroflexota bacterium]MYD17501.1 adenylosuccinate lyase family protein [Chloroflexota bacterium]